MKILRVEIFLILIVFVISLYSTGATDKNPLEKYKRKKQEHLKKYTLAQKNILLTHIKSFPDEQQIDQGAYLKSVTNMAVDFSSGLIFVPDNADHKILVFDLSGKFIKHIGQKGQGPSDFFRPFNVMLWNKYLVVNDVGNLRVQFIDKEGAYIKSFRTFKTYYTMAINNDGVTYGLHINKYGEKYLVDALSQDGKLLHSFGKLSTSKNSKDSLLRYSLFIDHEGFVYLGYNFDSKIKKFSAQGKLLNEIDLKYEPILNTKNLNLQQTNSKDRKSYCFWDFYILDDSIFVHVSGAVFEIVEFDMTGRIKKVFWNKDINIGYPYDLAVSKERGDYYFYTCHLLPDKQIDIFKSK